MSYLQTLFTTFALLFDYYWTPRRN